MSYSIDEQTGQLKRYLYKQMPTALIYTMNCTPKYYDMFHYETILGPVRQQMEAFFGSCEEIKAQGTWQFYPDYSKYDASAVDLEEKQWYRANQ